MVSALPTEQSPSPTVTTIETFYISETIFKNPYKQMKGSQLIYQGEEMK